jgi:hypothetical protein
LDTGALEVEAHLLGGGAEILDGLLLARDLQDLLAELALGFELLEVVGLFGFEGVLEFVEFGLGELAGFALCFGLGEDLGDFALLDLALGDLVDGELEGLGVVSLA